MTTAPHRSLYHHQKDFANVSPAGKAAMPCISSWNMSNCPSLMPCATWPRNTTSKSRNANCPTKKNRHEANARACSSSTNGLTVFSKTNSTTQWTAAPSAWPTSVRAVSGMTSSRNSNWATAPHNGTHWHRRPKPKATRKNTCSRPACASSTTAGNFTTGSADGSSFPYTP